MKRVALAALAGFAALAAASDAVAANLDCRGPATSVQRMICANPTLRAMDGALGERYDAAISLSFDPASLRAQEATWLAGVRDAATTRESLVQVYAARIGAVEKAVARLRAADSRRAIAAAEVENRCLPAMADPDAHETCQVLDFGEAGTVDGRRFVYSRYRYTPNEIGFPSYTRIVVFEQRDAATRAVAFDRPRLLRGDGRILLLIPGVQSGAGLANGERLFVWRADHWRDVDTTSWLEELERRLPAGYAALKGIYPNYVTLKASTELWRSDDDVACPTAGRADLALEWRADRITLGGVRLYKNATKRCAAAPAADESGAR